MTSVILLSWFIVEVPGKSGFPRSNSPKIQPTDHMSTANDLVVAPKKSSGDLEEKGG